LSASRNAVSGKEYHAFPPNASWAGDTLPPMWQWAVTCDTLFLLPKVGLEAAAAGPLRREWGHVPISLADWHSMHTHNVHYCARWPCVVMVPLGGLSPLYLATACVFVFGGINHFTPSLRSGRLSNVPLASPLTPHTKLGNRSPLCPSCLLEAGHQTCKPSLPS
jgi:hypothetical protein